MIMSKKLSVIVPVYNVEPYLRRCIDSIINQTYKNLEIILVDDGSPDNCGQICDEYANKDSRIIVIHQKNSGASVARNVGMDIASGEYISFVDSDDRISLDMYKDMINILECNDLDIVCCKDYRVVGSRIYNESGTGELKILGHDEILYKALLDYEIMPCNKVYRYNITRNVRFPEGRMFEDSATSYLFFDNAKKVGMLDKAYYYYYKNPNSVTQTSFKAKARYDCVLAYIERLEFAEKNNINCINECKSLLLKSVLSCLTSLYASEPSSENNKIFEELKKLIENYRDYSSYKMMNLKYKIYLWCFGRFDFIHRFGAKLSYFSKIIRKVVNNKCR